MLMKVLDIAIFVLATTKLLNFQSSWDTRVVPIYQTWGKNLEHLYFTMGTNVFDKIFLDTQCMTILQQQHNVSRGVGTGEIGRRILRARTQQTFKRNRLIEYKCSENLRASNRNIFLKGMYLNPNPNTGQITVLFAANCTGEYFGEGPSCRLQESIRHFIYDPKFLEVKWFGFIDDDVYLRPYVLSNLLKMFHLNDGSKDGGDVALLYSMDEPGLQFSTRWSPSSHNCNISGMHTFPYAMPCVINRKAVDTIKPAIDANGVTNLQKVWGGTHDALLGMLLWIYQINTYNLRSAFYDGVSLDGSEYLFLTLNSLNGMNRSGTAMAHRVKGATFKIKSERLGTSSFVYMASQYDVESYLGDNLLIDKDLNTDMLINKMSSFEAISLNVFHVVEKVKRSGISRTKFTSNLRQRRSYSGFSFSDC